MEYTERHQIVSTNEFAQRTFLVSGSSDKSRRNIEDQHRECRNSGDETELAECTDDEALEIEKPTGEDRHEHYLNPKQHPHRAVTEGGE